MIGAVGEHTRGVEKLLRRIGFSYAERVDPFDGGPHFICPTGDISLVKNSAEVVVELIGAGPLQPTELVARQMPDPPYFVANTANRTASGGAHLSEAAADRLGVTQGDRLWTLPIR
jgi:arginine N-succinyltransferase